jgi:hypothetical protein
MVGAAVELRRVISRYGDGAILANSTRYDSYTHFNSSRTVIHQARAWGSATYLTQPVLSLLAGHRCPNTQSRRQPNPPGRFSALSHYLIIAIIGITTYYLQSS